MANGDWITGSFGNMPDWGVFVGLGVLGLILGLLLLAFWIWMIVDAARRSYLNDIEKILWLVVVVLGGLVGALVYLIVIKISNPDGLARSPYPSNAQRETPSRTRRTVRRR